MKHRQNKPRCIDNDEVWADWNLTPAERFARESAIPPDWWEDLNPDQQWARDRIRAAHTLRTKETRMRMFDPHRTDKTEAQDTEADIKIQQDYVSWWKRCAGRGWNMTLIHGLIVDPMTTRIQVGPVLGNIERALNEYLRIG